MASITKVGSFQQPQAEPKAKRPRELPIDTLDPPPFQQTHTDKSLRGRNWHPPKIDYGPKWLEQFLESRHIKDIPAYFKPEWDSIRDGIETMADMPKAVERLCQAIDQHEPIVIYGDYDVDGVSSICILFGFLRDIGANVSYYIPNRLQDGYGLNKRAVEQLAPTHQLLITVDCGINANNEITLAQSLGLDVIVVDHHQVMLPMPPAVAILNPHRPDCQYPFKHLCAAGVAFMLLLALRKTLTQQGYFKQRDKPNLLSATDLVATATVADMVPILGVNRLLVMKGLERMNSKPRPGLEALLKTCEIPCRTVTEEDLGFNIGPRINALGRMGHAKDAVELLTTSNNTTLIADLLNAANKQRQETQQATMLAAEAQIKQDRLEHDAGLVVYHPDWHPGVLGLVASYLAETYQRPTLVIGQGGKGSGRSGQDPHLFDLSAVLGNLKDDLKSFGGHKPAAGLTIEEAKIPAFRANFIYEVKKCLGELPYPAWFSPDIIIQEDQLNLDLNDTIATLRPFGQQNKEPLFMLKNIRVRTKATVGADKSHLKLKLGEYNIDAIAFKMGRFLNDIPDYIDVIGYVACNHFNGRSTLQIRVEDIRLC